MQPELTSNALQVLNARYLQRNQQGQIVETPEQLFRRVARSLGQAEMPFGGQAAAHDWETRFYDLLGRLDFLPNSPTLMNAGTAQGQLSACFVLPVGDSMAEIFDSLKLAALIQQSGGGTGFSFSRLRPKDDYVSRVKAAGCRVISSANTVEESIWLEEHGCDAVIAQGTEAGGHRAMFRSTDVMEQAGTMALVPQIVDAL